MANPNPAVVSPATDVAAASSLSSTLISTLKSGWKTSEMWLTTLLIAGLGTVIEQLISMLKDYATQSGVNPVVVLAIPLAIAALGAAGAWAKVTYTKMRGDLKLATKPPATDAAAAGVVNATGLILAVIVAGLLFWPTASYAQACPAPAVPFAGGCVLPSSKVESCPDLLDAGTPEAAVKAAKGSILPSDAWVLSSGRMCAAGFAEQRCQAQADAAPVTLVVLSAAGGAVAVAVIAAVLSATGHLQLK